MYCAYEQTGAPSTERDVWGVDVRHRHETASMAADQAGGQAAAARRQDGPGRHREARAEEAQAGPAGDQEHHRQEPCSGRGSMVVHQIWKHQGEGSCQKSALKE